MKYLKEEVKEKDFKHASKEQGNWYRKELGEWTCRLRGVKAEAST